MADGTSAGGVKGRPAAATGSGVPSDPPATTTESVRATREPVVAAAAARGSASRVLPGARGNDAGPAGPQLPAPRAGGVGPRNPGVLAYSVLAPRGRGNVDGADRTLAGLELARIDPDERRVARLDPRRASDPASVADSGLAGVHPDVIALVRAHAPASAVAARLLELYGGYTADNDAPRRAAIVASLRWITADSGGSGRDVGMAYDHDRAAASPLGTQSPDETLSRRAGICRDFATCAAAILASLASAERLPDGSWRLGSPSGQESLVQAFSYANPTEDHAFTAFRDPVTGRWDTLEYGTTYHVQGFSMADAVAATVGSTAGVFGYLIDGWGGAPRPAAHEVLGAARANEFFEYDPGSGVARELRASAGPADVRLAYFATPRLSLVASLDPSALGNGLRGGVKLSYHRDFEALDAGGGGYVRLAGGVYSDVAHASRWTGSRAVSTRARYGVLVTALQLDGRKEVEARAVVGEHLRVRLGADWNVRLGVPLWSGPGASLLTTDALGDYSRVDLGADLTSSGRESLPGRWRLEWAVRLRGQVDVITTAVEAVLSGGEVEQGLGRDPLRTTFALALSRCDDDGLVTRIEVGGTRFAAPSLDASAGAIESHYAVVALSPADGVVDFGLLARGETRDGRFQAASAIGVALDLRPRGDLTVGIGAELRPPAGDWRRAGEGVWLRVGVDAVL